MVSFFLQLTQSIVLNLIVGVALAMLLGFSQPVHAQTTAGGLQIEPSFQELSIADTQASVSASLTITNHSNQPQTIEVFAVDIKQFDDQGRVVLADKPLTSADYTLADFISLDQSEWLIAPNANQVIPFSIKNTPRLSPGGHYAALITRLPPSAATVKQEVLPAVSSFVLVKKIGGEQYHLSLTNLEQNVKTWWWSVPETVELAFSNQGNIHVTPRGTIELVTPWGEVTHKGIINENSLYVFPGSQRQITASVRSTNRYWPAMWYDVRITVRSEPGDIQIQQHLPVLYVHWPVAMLLALVCMIIMSWVVGKKTKRHHAS